MTASSRTSRTPGLAVARGAGPSCPARPARTSWAASPRKPCRCCPAWPRGTPSAISGFPPCRPRRCPTGRSPAREPARGTWTTRRTRSPRRRSSGCSGRTGSRGGSTATTRSRSRRPRSPTSAGPRRAISGCSRTSPRRPRRDAARVHVPGAQLELDRQQPAPELRRGPGRAAHPRRVRGAPGRSRVGADAPGHHLRRARRLLRPRAAADRRGPAGQGRGRVRFRLHPVRAAGPGRAGVAADRAGHRVPGPGGRAPRWTTRRS